MVAVENWYSEYFIWDISSIRRRYLWKYLVIVKTKDKNESRILGNSTAQIEHATGLLGGFHCLIMSLNDLSVMYRECS